MCNKIIPIKIYEIKNPLNIPIKGIIFAIIDWTNPIGFIPNLGSVKKATTKITIKIIIGIVNFSDFLVFLNFFKFRSRKNMIEIKIITISILIIKK